MSTVVGVDVSLTGTGVASSAGWVELVGSKGVTSMPLPQRVAALDKLRRAIVELVGSPTLAVIESPSFRSSGGGVLERSALWWGIVHSLVRADVPVATVTPKARAKYATGNGSAGKSAVIHAVATRMPNYDTGGNDNLVDAAVLAAMGADWLGEPLAVMPARHREALKHANWPNMGVPR